MRGLALRFVLPSMLKKLSKLSIHFIEGVSRTTDHSASNFISSELENTTTDHFQKHRRMAQLGKRASSDLLGASVLFFRRVASCFQIVFDLDSLRHGGAVAAT